MRSSISKKQLFILFIAAITVFVVIWFVLSGYSEDSNQITEAIPAEPGYKIKKVIRYSFTVQNTQNKLLKNPEFWAYAPVKQTAHQKVVKLKATHKYDLTEDELGNQIMHFKFPYLVPHAAKVITVTAEMAMSSLPNTVNEKLDVRKMYLGSEANIEVDNDAVSKLAQEMTSGLERDTSKKIFDWINTNINYSGYIKDDRGAAYALEAKKGDCTEYAYLYTALARANQIPSKVIGGYVYKTNAVLDPTDFHNWSEYYADGKWHLVDPQGNKHEQDQQDYIAMRIISQKQDSKMGNSHRFITVGNGLKVKLNK